MNTMNTQMWPLSRLRPNQKNPRGSLGPDSNGIAVLADSIRAQGILQPLLITPQGTVVAGHRRLVAARLAGLEEAPVIVRQMDEEQQIEIMLVENCQRSDLTVLEEARTYAALLRRMTTAEIARKTGLPHNRIHSRVLLLQFEPTIQRMFDRGELQLNLARDLASIPNNRRRQQIANMAAARGLNLKQLQELIRRSEPLKAPIEAAPEHQPTHRLRLPTGEPDDSREVPVNSAGRREVLARLSVSTRSWKAGDVVAAFRRVCCACGMEDEPEVCAVCPMVQLVNDLLKVA